MALEIDKYKVINGVNILHEQKELDPDGFKRMNFNPKIDFFIGGGNDSALVLLDGVEHVYAIMYGKENNNEGEILDIHEGSIRLTHGQDLCLVVNKPYCDKKEIWASMTHKGAKHLEVENNNDEQQHSGW